MKVGTVIRCMGVVSEGRNGHKMMWSVKVGVVSEGRGTQ